VGGALRVNFSVNRENDGQNGQNGGAQAPNPLSDPVRLVRVAALLAERRKRKSVRGLAKEIGISKSALDGLVTAYNEGREMPTPHTTWQKLKDWYLAQKQNEPGPLDDPVDIGLLAIKMLADLPDAERHEGVRELVEATRQIYERRQIPPPAWVARLAQALDEEPEEF
jgi:hypothetical protein